MSDLVLEINDVDLVVSDGQQAVVSSPACAVLDGPDIFLGQEAFDRSRLKPLWTNTRFWSGLNQEPLSNPSGRFRTNADLAHAHLEYIWQQLAKPDSGLIVAVPGTWNQEQMGLMLGIASDLDIPVLGMVDAAVAAAISLEPDLPTLHLDLQQQRIVLTELKNGDQLSRAGVFVVCETGLSALRDNWANIVADIFVRQTRFDPMHKAETEQQLFNKLDSWLADVESGGNTSIDLEADDKTYTVQLGVDHLLSASSAVYPQIVQQIRPRQGRLMAISHRMTGFPGLKESLGLIDGLEPRWLDENAAARGMLARPGLCNSGPGNGEVGFLSSLPLSGGSSPARSAMSSNTKPSHLLYRARAYSLSDGPLVLGIDPPENERSVKLVGVLDGVSRKHCTVQSAQGRTTVEDHSSYGTFVNGRKITEFAELALGDVIRMGSPGETVQLISIGD